jgi:hypothetical protein
MPNVELWRAVQVLDFDFIFVNYGYGSMQPGNSRTEQCRASNGTGTHKEEASDICVAGESVIAARLSRLKPLLIKQIVEACIAQRSRRDANRTRKRVCDREACRRDTAEHVV